MMYATFKWLDLGGYHTNTKAIACPTEENLRDCVMDICSLNGLINLRINRCGRLPKGTTIIPWEVYKKDYTWINTM